MTTLIVGLCGIVIMCSCFVLGVYHERERNKKKTSDQQDSPAQVKEKT